jgi:hypothetical protein
MDAVLEGMESAIVQVPNGLSNSPTFPNVQAPDEQPQPLQTFTLFNKLPTEIRLTIWKLATPGPRVIRIDVDSSNKYALGIGNLLIPSIMHICRESREVGSRLYSLGFGHEDTECAEDWFNPELDTLYIPHCLPPMGWPTSVACDFELHRPNAYSDRERGGYELDAFFFWCWECPTISKAQHVAMSYENYLIHFSSYNGNHDGIDDTGLARYLLTIPCLKSLSFVIDKFPRWHRTGDIVLSEPPSEIPIQPEEIKPSIAKREITSLLRHHKNKNDPAWEIPEVKICFAEFMDRTPEFHVPPPPQKSLEEALEWLRSGEGGR